MDWLSEKGSKHPKHLGWRHPLAVCLVHYGLVLAVSIAVHDWLVGETADCNITIPLRRLYTARGLAAYVVWLLAYRLSLSPHPFHIIVYEFTWLCNVTLCMSAFGLYTGRPLIASAYCVTVGIDQLLWYVDLLAYLVVGRFPIGVCKYLFWDGTTWANRITATHHLWTIPVVLYATQGLHWLALPLSGVYMTTNVLLSRYMTPPCVRVSPEEKEEKYLNVNLAHALWKDIQIKCLEINHGDPSAPVYLVRLLSRWQGFNLLVFIALSGLYAGGLAPKC
jgi:hypothetical protein